MKPSVDRETLRSNPQEALRSPNAGLARLSAMAVRQIKLNDAVPPQISVDVIPDPIAGSNQSESNPAHALIVSSKTISDGKFRRIREALARLAEKDIVVLPQSYRDR